MEKSTGDGGERKKENTSIKCFRSYIYKETQHLGAHQKREKGKRERRGRGDYWGKSVRLNSASKKGKVQFNFWPGGKGGEGGRKRQLLRIFYSFHLYIYLQGFFVYFFIIQKLTYVHC